MQESIQTIELVFIVPVGSEADALIGQLRSLMAGAAPVSVAELAVDDALGAVASEKIISAVLAFSLNVAAGVLGNVVYNLLQSHPNAQCVAGETPLQQENTQDPTILEAKLRAAACPAKLPSGH